MYKEIIYQYGPFIEHEIKHPGKCGAKGEKREKKKKATPEQVRKQNQYNKEKKVLRETRANFEVGDLWVTLKFPAGTRMQPEELIDIRKKFLNNLRDNYNRRKTKLKFMCRAEIGERGGVHLHLIVNQLENGGAAELIQRLWKKYGTVHFVPLYEEGHFKQLAEYLVKPLKEEISGQMTLWGTEEETKLYSRYTCSRNLIEPEPEEHIYKRRTVRKLVEEGPTPKEGYYIDRDSIRSGVNPFTGMSYFYYTEIRLDAYKSPYSGAVKKRGEPE